MKVLTEGTMGVVCEDDAFTGGSALTELALAALGGRIGFTENVKFKC